MTQTNSAAWPNGAPVVGQRVERSCVVGDGRIELFTAISGDRNRLRDDADRASRTRSGGIVVQGGITSAILNAVVAEDLPGPGTRVPERELEVQGAGTTGRHDHRWVAAAHQSIYDEKHRYRRK